LMAMSFLAQVLGSFTITFFVRLMRLVEKFSHLITLLVRLVTERSIMRVFLVNQILIMSIVDAMAFRRPGLFILLLLFVWLRLLLNGLMMMLLLVLMLLLSWLKRGILFLLLRRPVLLWWWWLLFLLDTTSPAKNLLQNVDDDFKYGSHF